MADIDSNQHGSFLGQRLRELHLKQITANLAVDLPQDVGCFGKIELSRIPDCDNL